MLPICKPFQCMGLFLTNQRKEVVFNCSKRVNVFNFAWKEQTFSKLLLKSSVCFVIDYSKITFNRNFFKFWLEGNFFVSNAYVVIIILT